MGGGGSVRTSVSHPSRICLLAQHCDKTNPYRENRKITKGLSIINKCFYPFAAKAMSLE